jgi:hypothetical protein
MVQGFIFEGDLQFSKFSLVLAVRPARRTNASAPLSDGAASPPPPVGMERGESAAPEFTS